MEEDNGVLLQLEPPKVIKNQKNRIRLVTNNIRKLVITEYHYTPVAGHIGVYKNIG